MFNASSSIDRAWSLPPECYLGGGWAGREREAVFGASWLPACRLEQVAKAGEVFALDLAGEPVVVARDAVGELRAFSNVCRHRAARVAPAGCGRVERLTCPYHGWMYDLAGHLVGIPQGDGMTGFRREEHPLPAWHIGVWDRWVWVHPPHPSPQPLESQICTIQAWLGNRLDDFRWVASREYRVACDWKVFVDNYLDGGYHVGPVHPGLAAGLVGKAYKTEVFAGSSLQSCPLEGEPPGGMAWYWHVWPGWMLNLYGDTADTNLVLPDGPGRCRVLFDWYRHGEVAPGQLEAMLASSDQVQREDMAICEEVQANLGGRFYRGGPFVPRREAAGWRFHQEWARAVGFDGRGVNDV